MAEDHEPVTISAPPAGSVTIDPHNPLPEPSFMWRRVFAAVVGLNALVFAWFAAHWFNSGQQWSMLFDLTKLVIYGAGLILTYYFVAPSASELTSIIQSASIFKHSIAASAASAVANAPQPPSGAPTARFAATAAPDSQIPASAPGEAPMGFSGDVGNSADDDVAPRGQP